jgi:cell division inhibitor SulA/protein ImuA
MLVVDVGTRQDALWAGEQALRSGACCAVLLWPERLQPGPGGRGPVASPVRPAGEVSRSLRRLQLAAETGSSLGVIFRHLDMVAQASPAPLRLALHAGCGDGAGPYLELLKARGGRRRRIALAQLGPAP